MACQHCNLMDTYYSAREAQERRVEEHTKGYATEEAEYYSTVEEKVTFKAFLQQRMMTRD